MARAYARRVGQPPRSPIQALTAVAAAVVFATALAVLASAGTLPRQ
jgi:hypothetical protein